MSSGTVAFYDNATVIGNATVNSSGAVTETWTPTTTGNHQVLAHYLANSTYLGSFSAQLTVKVTTGLNLGLVCIVSPI